MSTERPADLPVFPFLSAGAAQGLLRALQPRFEAEQGHRLEGRFGAVGAMKEALDGGAPCEFLVLTQALVHGLVAAGRFDGASVRALGTVYTGVATRTGAPRPAVETEDGLRAALLGASAIHFPDPARATAGIHFAKVLRELGIEQAVAARCRTHPNGATAMKALADEGDDGAIGCTQVTEIRYTPGVDLIALLPKRFELGTVYAAALRQGSPLRAQGEALMALVAGPESAALRRAGGFE